MDDLLDIWNARSVDTAELEQVLLSYFRSVGFGDGYALYGEADRPRLTLKYKSGRPISAVPELHFSEADLHSLSHRIQDQLLTYGTTEISKRALFTTLSVDGYYRYRDTFQIVPVPSDAPRPDAPMLAMNPFLLEVSYPSSPEPIISMIRRGRVERELECLCAVFLWLPIEHIRNVRCRWVLNPDGATSSHRQEGYRWPHGGPVGEAFSSLNELEPMTLVDPLNYYARFNYSYSDRLDLPSNITKMFDAFFSLSLDCRRRFLRASYWFHHATNVWAISNSAAFVAMVSAIEALMPSTQPSDTCPTCKRRSGPGPTAQFVAFVESYAGDRPTTSEQRRTFYSLRSALSHGGRLFDSDQGIWIPGATGATEMFNLRSMSGVARAVLCTWLENHASEHS